MLHRGRLASLSDEIRLRSSDGIRRRRISGREL